MAGISLPKDRKIDGVDMMPILTGEAGHTLHDHFFFITKDKVLAAQRNSGFEGPDWRWQKSYLFRL